MDKKDANFGGYVNKIYIGGTYYKLQCEVIEVHPMICPRCGGNLELHFGEGKCEYCGTNFTTKFILEPV